MVSQEEYSATGDHYEPLTRQFTANGIPAAESPIYVNKVSVPKSLTYNNQKPTAAYENVP